jgi:hypothetical protein
MQIISSDWWADVRFEEHYGLKPDIAPYLLNATYRRVSDLRLRFRSAFLRDCSVCFHNGIVESPTGNRAHTIETGEDA